MRFCLGSSTFAIYDHSTQISFQSLMRFCLGSSGEGLDCIPLYISEVSIADAILFGFKHQVGECRVHAVRSFNR